MQSAPARLGKDYFNSPAYQQATENKAAVAEALRREMRGYVGRLETDEQRAEVTMLAEATVRKLCAERKLRCNEVRVRFANDVAWVSF